jgi:hypothetical protein
MQNQEGALHATKSCVAHYFIQHQLLKLENFCFLFGSHHNDQTDILKIKGFIRKTYLRFLTAAPPISFFTKGITSATSMLGGTTYIPMH